MAVLVTEYIEQSLCMNAPTLVTFLLFEKSYKLYSLFTQIAWSEHVAEVISVCFDASYRKYWTDFSYIWCWDSTPNI